MGEQSAGDGGNHPEYQTEPWAFMWNNFAPVQHFPSWPRWKSGNQINPGGLVHTALGQDSHQVDEGLLEFPEQLWSPQWWAEHFWSLGMRS